MEWKGEWYLNSADSTTICMLCIMCMFDNATIQCVNNICYIDVHCKVEMSLNTFCCFVITIRCCYPSITFSALCCRDIRRWAYLSRNCIRRLIYIIVMPINLVYRIFENVFVMLYFFINP